MSRCPVCPGPARRWKNPRETYYRPRTQDGYEVIGVEPPGTPCSYCGDTDGTVYLIRDPFQGVAGERLHEDCATAWLKRPAARSSGLGEARRQELVEWCRKLAAEGKDPEDELRMILREELASGDDIEAELARIMQLARRPK